MAQGQVTSKPRLVAAGTGGGAGVALTELLSLAGVHVTPTIAAAVSVLAAALSAAHAHHLTVKQPPAPQPKTTKLRKSPQLTMFDTIWPYGASPPPAHAAAVAGYVGGRFPNFGKLRRRYPRAYHLPIAVTAHEDAHCLDIESGDATPAQAPDWVKRQHRRGIHRPALYCSVSSMAEVLRLLKAAGVPRDHVLLFTAHYTFVAHLCSPRCGFGFDDYADATQYTNHYGGAELDASLVSAGFFLTRT